MIEEKVEIVLITYNRAKDLENTFKQLIESPFSDCKFTVLDNCSTDITPKICVKWQKIFPNMNIIRHDKNIGAGPNALRAVETSNSIYTWILCDDDNYDFSNCSDVLNAIESEEFDIIIVTSHYLSGWERGLKTNSIELIERGAKYYNILSFLPSIIFKTSLYDSDCFLKGYSNVNNLYPHFEFINKSVNNRFSVYVSKNAIVVPGTNNSYSFSQLKWVTYWINSCATIKNKKIRKKAIYGYVKGGSFLKDIILKIIFEKKRNISAYKNIFSLALSFIISFEYSKETLLLFIIIPLAIFPSFPFRYIRTFKKTNK
ncbi:glycosyltransferase family 2 protein [uncultured Methanobacterium sp.]|uniref:glycosyltransferase family 2 protein n=1 Tax=uncultured Methanobacterium sp. TaxID=176306 RepID=UPI002AA71C51|nr:glycosyltransferase family 2 protein [uncultured Methanobacterium sp.]